MCIETKLRGNERNDECLLLLPLTFFEQLLGKV